MTNPSHAGNEKDIRLTKKQKMESKRTTANTAGSKTHANAKPRFGKQKGCRGLGKAGAKRLGQMIRKAIQQKEGAQGNGNKPLPKTPVALLKHHADVMAKVISSEKRKLVPRVSDLILEIIAQCKNQGGISMVELKKALAAGGYDVSKNNTQVNRAVKGLVRTETLVRTQGKGTPESYRFNTKKLKDDKRMRTRAARKREADKAMEDCPQVKTSTAEKASKNPIEASTKPAERENKQARKAGPRKKPAKPAKNAKPKAKASPRQAKKSPKKGGNAKTKARKRNGKGKRK